MSKTVTIDLARLHEASAETARTLPEPYRSMVQASRRARRYERWLQRVLARDEKIETELLMRVMKKGFDVSFDSNYAVYNPSTIVGYGFAVAMHPEEDQYFHTHTRVRVAPAANPKSPSWEHKTNIGELASRHL